MESEEEGEDEANAEKLNSLAKRGRWETGGTETVGARQNKSKMGFTGRSTPSNRSNSVEADIAVSVGIMTEHVVAVLCAMTAEQGPSLSEEDIRRLEKGEVKGSLRTTSDLLKKITEMIEVLSKKKKQSVCKAYYLSCLLA